MSHPMTPLTFVGGDEQIFGAISPPTGLEIKCYGE